MRRPPDSSGDGATMYRPERRRNPSMKVEIDIDESWTLLSVVVKKLLDDVKLSEEDRANLRRWRSEDMRTNGKALRDLLQKLNDDIERSQKNKQRSLIQKHDWV